MQGASTNMANAMLAVAVTWCLIVLKSSFVHCNFRGGATREPQSHSRGAGGCSSCDRTIWAHDESGNKHAAERPRVGCVVMLHDSHVEQ